ncbi:hypothetical protein AURDEDRAFT_178620 [Auricularia subglabra TFB-10046 SS5]|uniref:Uncharacterized protein n=1 Tax=Auricularia subglabra (strain TFB-10046 / SS5) TaxID=717982 RepID=J0WJ57_AURST|nr:hypothetical protein AURDEDRAFT_178620 [Auricularia subglabra TFB-10046 SS5]
MARSPIPVPQTRQDAQASRPGLAQGLSDDDNDNEDDIFEPSDKNAMLIVYIILVGLP